MLIQFVFWSFSLTVGLNIDFEQELMILFLKNSTLCNCWISISCTKLLYWRPPRAKIHGKVFLNPLSCIQISCPSSLNFLQLVYLVLKSSFFVLVPEFLCFLYIFKFTVFLMHFGLGMLNDCTFFRNLNNPVQNLGFSFLSS